jgi:peptidyl-prolyl cis-trans isomerase D
MLQFVRNNLKKFAPVLWVVIAVFVLLVFADVQWNRPGEVSPSSTAASVGPHKITYGEFRRAYEGLEARMRAAYGDSYTPDLARQMGVPLQAMNQLVTQRIVLTEAERMGLVPTEDELRRAILEVPVFLDDQGRFIGYEQYEQVLKSNRYPVQQFERDIREQVLLDKFNSVLEDSVWISNAEIERQAREDAEIVSIRWAHLTGDALPGIAVDDDQIASFFDTNRADYRLPEQRRVGYLSVNVNAVRAGLEIPAEELRAYYDSHQEEFTRQEQVRAQHILLYANAERSAEEAQRQLLELKARAEAGEGFQQLANQHSEDEATSARGGDLGFFGRGQMTAQFEAAAFSAQPGSIVGPIENQLGPRTGYHLINVLAHQDGGVQPFEEVENRIRVRLLNERAQEQTEAKARALYDQVKGQSALDEEALRALAETEGVAFEVPQPFALEDTIPGIGRATELHQRAFALEPNVLSEPVRIATGWALLVVLEVLPPRDPEFSEVVDRVRADALAEARQQAALANAGQLVDQVRAGAAFDQLLAGLGLSAVEGATLRATGTLAGLPAGEAKAVITAALEREVGEPGGPVETAQGAVVFVVVERQHFDPATLEGQRETLQQQLVTQRVNSLIASLIEQRRTQLEVRYSRSFVDTYEVPESPTDS